MTQARYRAAATLLNSQLSKNTCTPTCIAVDESPPNMFSASEGGGGSIDVHHDTIIIMNDHFRIKKEITLI
jgi:hypothetical protein